VKTPSTALWMLLVFVAPAFGQIPSNAISTTNLNTYDTWGWRHDPGTPGWSSGSSSYPVTNPSVDGLSRSFSISYSGRGGEIYFVSFGYDTTATHFVYDTYIYLEDPSQVKNVELDLNQVLDDGKTVIMATQCSGYSGTWEYTFVSGDRTHWRASNIACDPTSWTPKKWHHVQIAMHRDSSGVVTHDWLSFDGTSYSFNNAASPAGKYLGWQIGHLILNFQLDGSRDNGTMKAYVDKLTVYRWTGSGGPPPPPPPPSGEGSGDQTQN
jgi:hypothetical protein